MRFDKNHKAIIKSLLEDEVDAYCEFLGKEKERHWREIDSCQGMITYYQALIQLYKSALIRHKEDIDGSERNIKEARRY